MVRKLAGLGVNVREETKAALVDANDIARAQLIRFRRRLGTLTHDQELQIEDLLISTVAKILASHLHSGSSSSPAEFRRQCSFHVAG